MSDKYFSKNNMKLLIDGLKIGMISDWNENNKNNPGYIKNRPFYEDETGIHYIDPKYIKDMYYEKIVELFSIENAKFEDGGFVCEPGFPIIDGNTYIVSWDGVEYTCEAYTFEGIPAIGSTVAFGGKGNEEPFVIGYDSAKNITFVYNFDDLTVHTFSVTKVTYITIPHKYIKDMYYAEIINETIYETLEFTATSESTLNRTLVAGDAEQVYNNISSISKIKIDGNDYDVTATFDRGYFGIKGDMLSATGYYKSGRDFTITSKDTSVLSFVENQTYLVSFASNEESVSYHKINASYIPISSDFIIEDGLIKSIVGRKYGAASKYAGEIFNDLDNNEAPAEYSHAEGQNTTASGQASHAEGLNAQALGEQSHAEGINTTASGYYSHAEGFGTTASGNASHAEGLETIASGKNQHVQGKHNIEDAELKYAHIVGNGTSNTARSNAHTLDWNGVGWFQGGLQVGGNAQDDGAKNVMLEGNAYDYFILNDVSTGTPYKIQIIDGNLVSSAIVTETESTT